MSDKTEAPTPKRLRKAKEEGQSPLSTFASQSVAFACAIAIAPFAASALVAHAGGALRDAIARAGDVTPEVVFDAMAMGSTIVVATAPILAAAAASSAIASIVQTGGVIASKKVLPSLAKLSPTEGMKQLLSAPRLVAVLRAALFAGAIVWVIDSALRSNAASLARAAGRPDVAAALASTIALDVAKKAAAIGLALAVLDVVVTRRSWRKALMMTPREIARERKESEGDPELKAARGRAHQTMLAAAAIGDVARARIVIVSPRHVACALRYDGPEHGGRDAAPVLLASGRGERAARIALAAHQHDVPVVYDDVVAHALVKLEIGDEIPEALYEAVAELLRESG